MTEAGFPDAEYKVMGGMVMMVPPARRLPCSRG